MLGEGQRPPTLPRVPPPDFVGLGLLPLDFDMVSSVLYNVVYIHIRGLTAQDPGISAFQGDPGWGP